MGTRSRFREPTRTTPSIFFHSEVLMELRSRLQRRQRGFSRLDLTLTLAMLALAGGATLVLAEKVREDAKATACLKQLKQISFAFTEYAADYKGRFPRPAPHLDPKFEKLTQPQDEDWIYWQTLPQPRDIA